MRFLFRPTIFVAFTLLALAAPFAAAQDSVPLLARMVNDLGSNSDTRRQKAEEVLIAAGPEVDRVLAGATWSQHSEIRSRARSIIRRRRINQVWEPTLATYPGGDVSLADINQHFSRTFGPGAVSFRGFEHPFDPLPLVRMPAGEVPALQALADAADQLGGRILSTRSMGHRDSWPSVEIGDCRNFESRSCSGPTMVELTQVTQGKGRLRFEFLLFWEPRFELVSYSAEPLEYQFTWNDGEQSTLTIPIRWQTNDDWANPYRDLRPVKVTADFHGVEPTATIKRLKVKWPMCAAGTVGKVVIGPVEPGKRMQTEVGDIVIDAPGEYSLENIRSWPEPKEAIALNYNWNRGRTDLSILNQFEQTETGGQWNIRTFPWLQDAPLHLDYRSDFSRKDLEYTFEDINVIPSE